MSAIDLLSVTLSSIQDGALTLKFRLASVEPQNGGLWITDPARYVRRTLPLRIEQPPPLYQNGAHIGGLMTVCTRWSINLLT